MSRFTHIATSSKLGRILGFGNEADANAQAEQWEAEFPRTNPRDLNTPSTVYTWDEWREIAEANEADPMEGIENA